jgi:hypothetical protein
LGEEFPKLECKWSGTVGLGNTMEKEEVNTHHRHHRNRSASSLLAPT